MKFPKYDYITREWYFMGKWYREFPSEIVDGYYDALAEKYEGKREEERCTKTNTQKSNQKV